MAAISLRDVVLYGNKIPGPVNPMLGPPPDGWDSTKEGSGNCVDIPAYPVGTKVMAYNDGTYNPGWYTMAYLQFCEGSDSAYDAGDPSTGYGACFHYEATEHLPDGGNAGKWYAVTHDLTNSDGTKGGFIAFPVCDLSGADATVSGYSEHGWFWVEGVCPCVTLDGKGGTDCTRLAGVVKTNGDVVAGQEIFVEGDGTGQAAFSPFCLTSLFEVTLGFDATTFCSPIGYATNADA